jgi:3-methyladenine DNA glycosylase AlkD
MPKRTMLRPSKDRMRLVQTRVVYERASELRRTAIRLNKSIAWVLSAAYELAREQFLGRKLREIEAKLEALAAREARESAGADIVNVAHTG